MASSARATYRASRQALPRIFSRWRLRICIISRTWVRATGTTTTLLSDALALFREDGNSGGLFLSISRRSAALEHQRAYCLLLPGRNTGFAASVSAARGNSPVAD